MDSVHQSTPQHPEFLLASTRAMEIVIPPRLTLSRTARSPGRRREQPPVQLHTVPPTPRSQRSYLGPTDTAHTWHSVWYHAERVTDPVEGYMVVIFGEHHSGQSSGTNPPYTVGDFIPCVGYYRGVKAVLDDGYTIIHADRNVVDAVIYPIDGGPCLPAAVTSFTCECCIRTDKIRMERPMHVRPHVDPASYLLASLRATVNWFYGQISACIAF